MSLPGSGAARSAPLDGIRGFAVLLVFLSHSSGRSLYPSASLQFQGIGHVGVYLFFVLSSWLLTSNLLRELSVSNRIELKSYFLKRLLRIYPLYFTVVTGVFLCQLIFGSYTPNFLHVSDGFTGYLKHIFLFQGDSVFWTIPVEVIYYMLIPPIACFISKSKWLAIFVLSLFALGFSIWTEALYPGTNYQFSIYPKIVDISHRTQFVEVFLVGSIFAGINHLLGDEFFSKKGAARSLDWIVLVTFLVFLSYTAKITCAEILWFERSDFWFKFHSGSFALVFSALVFVAGRFPSGVTARVFGNRLLCAMGILGFSWYLLHFPVLQLTGYWKSKVPEFVGSDLVFFVLSWILCGVVSYISFLLIERPFMSLSARVGRSDVGPRVS